MPLSHHPLVQEFPQYKAAIHQLKMTDSRFHNLMEQYEELDKQIFRIEDGEEPTSDEFLEGLKKQRVALKDQIFHMLKPDS